MFPAFKTPQSPTEDFGAECKRRFINYTAARKQTPFHKDKRKYDALAWAEVDAYLDWCEINAL